jgi:agmatine deiminase
VSAAPSTPEGTPQALGYRMPAEWEEHAATWLTWPYSEDWPGKLEAVRWTFAEITRQLVRGERVRMIVPGVAERDEVEKWLCRANIDTRAVDFFVARTDRTWTRDNLPTFVVNREQRRVGAVKWRFNGWARYPDHELDDAAGCAVASAHGDPAWFPAVQIVGKPWRFVLEGGSIDVDGEGTVLTTRRCLLGSSCARNPGLDQAGTEAVLAQHLDISHVVWLEDGIAGDDTSGHIDDFARFVSPGRVVIARENDPADPNHALLEAARRELLSARDARGRSLDVVDLPMPAPLYFDGERLPASYANFYVANESVLVPTFNDPNDRVALGILAELFPSRRVCGVHAVDLVVGLGTLHCSTQQEPL